jgi:hypothetical protein
VSIKGFERRNVRERKKEEKEGKKKWNVIEKSKRRALTKHSKRPPLDAIVCRKIRQEGNQPFQLRRKEETFAAVQSK